MPHVETSRPEQRFASFDVEPQLGRSVALSLLLAGTLVTVRTTNTVYRIVVLDGPARRVSISGGRLFPESTDVELAGATDRDEVFKGGWIVEGLHLELLTDRGPVSTSIVESLAVDVDVASVTDEHETVE